jgi:hypothetical protein
MMISRSWRVGVLAVLCVLTALWGVRAEDPKPTDEGKAVDFKGKTLAVKDKGKASIILAFPGGKEATIEVKGEKKTDINLYVLDTATGKEVAKDDSPGPDCLIKYTPKADGKLILELRNLGPGDNSATVKVSVAK